MIILLFLPHRPQPRYWGQNSYGATNPTDTANQKQPISFYFQAFMHDDYVDIIPITFLDEFNTTGGLPSVNLANTYNTSDSVVFPGTALTNCTFRASDMSGQGQDRDHLVTISLGGETGVASFTNDAEGEAFAQIIWDLFFGGFSTIRPFGGAVLDGSNMGIDGRSQTGFIAFLTTLRQLMDGGGKPGREFVRLIWDADNDYCGLTHYNNTNICNIQLLCGRLGFGYLVIAISPRPPSEPSDHYIRDNWAKAVSPNPNAKVFIGAPESPSAAGSGYVDSSTMAIIIDQTRSPAGVWVEARPCSSVATAKIVPPSAAAEEAQVTFGIPSYRAMATPMPMPRIP
ncbi:glycoside hydrolase [Gyrodon lividus]|nr:glycoside hydrolase [Gyrodon lividus]